jgi:hypothetical protein
MYSNGRRRWQKPKRCGIYSRAFNRHYLSSVLNEIKMLGFGGPGLNIHVLKGHSHPVPVLEGEGRIYNIFGVRAF